MPVIDSSYSRPHFVFTNPHLHTIYPHFFRRFPQLQFQRERIKTPDNDFLDLDWSRVGSSRLAILAHGLEGCSRSSYMQGMSLALNTTHNQLPWDTLAINFRGCSGSINQTLKTFHSGAIDDLETVINHASSFSNYTEIVLIGFSLGGNVVLLYLGKRCHTVNTKISAAVAFSVPCHLLSSVEALNKNISRVYQRYFIQSMKRKVLSKAKYFSELSLDKIDQIRTFKEFDDRYTAPLNGFQNALEYWEQCSSLKYLSDIKINTLLINAKDDPMLGSLCYPAEQAKSHPNFSLEIPHWGGHVGFIGKHKLYWSEQRALSFINQEST